MAADQFVATPTLVAWTSARPDTISPLSSWRYRLKSVLQESDSRFDRESDLGPLPLPGRTYSAVIETPKLAPSRAVVPLRC
jgi:hypothetical protein